MHVIYGECILTWWWWSIIHVDAQCFNANLVGVHLIPCCAFSHICYVVASLEVSWYVGFWKKKDFYGYIVLDWKKKDFYGYIVLDLKYGITIGLHYSMKAVQGRQCDCLPFSFCQQLVWNCWKDQKYNNYDHLFSWNTFTHRFSTYLLP